MSEYKQAISLVDFQLAIKDSSDEQLHIILGKLQTSIGRLIESNELMQRLMNKEKKEKAESRSEDDEDDEFDPVTDHDIKIYCESIKENELVIENQKDRCQIIEEELNIRNLPGNSSFADVKQSAHADYASFNNGIPISTDNDI